MSDTDKAAKEFATPTVEVQEIPYSGPLGMQGVNPSNGFYTEGDKIEMGVPTADLIKGLDDNMSAMFKHVGEQVIKGNGLGIKQLDMSQYVQAYLAYTEARRRLSTQQTITIQF